MKAAIIALMLMINTITPQANAQIKANVNQWELIGECRITCYCQECNDGSGHESSSGKYLEYGDCACNFLPTGTVVSVEGEEFTVVDTCGIDNTIDIFIDTEECNCNLLEYRKVAIKRD